MGLYNSVIKLIVGLVVGTLGIHVGALVILGESTLATAASTAVGGAVVWFLASHFFGWLPLLGLILTFIVWLGFINGQYPGGLETTAKIAGIAWAASIAADQLLKILGFRNPDAVGIPEA